MKDDLKTIVVDLTPLLPGGENGGAKIFVLELIRELGKLAPQTEFILLIQEAAYHELKHLNTNNVRCLVIMKTTFFKNAWIEKIRTRLHKLPFIGHRLVGLAYRLYRILNRRQAQSIVTKVKAHLLFCPFTAPTYFEPGVPTVCTIYDLQYKTYPEFFRAEEVIHRHHVFVEACRQATMLTAISDYSRQSAIQHGGIAPDKIRTIYLQMAHRILPTIAQDLSILERLNVEKGEYLLYPANFWKHKNHEMLITAFGMACQQQLPQNIKLVCSGTVSDRLSWLKEAVSQMNLASRVLFPGYLTNNELAALLANSRGVIFPSLYEGFGLPLIEATAAGVPVACSFLTSLPEVAGKAALLFNPRIPTQIAQAMITLSVDNERRQALINAGKERAAAFSDSEHMAKEYLDLFQHAMQNNKPQDSITGAYKDGWASAEMKLHIAPSATQQTLEMEFFAPDWLPQAKVVVKARQKGKSKEQALDIMRGNTASLSLVLPTNGGHYEIRMTPTFVPKETGHSEEDERELSLIVQRCCVRRNNGETIELISRMKLT